MKQLSSQDDRLHPPGSAVDWRESYYFGFYGEAGQTGMTYISLSPNQRIIVRMILMLMPEEGRTLVYVQQDPLSHLKDTVLEEGELQFYCLEPLQCWQLQADLDCLSIPRREEISSALAAARTQTTPVEHVPVAFDLCFETRMPPYGFPPIDFLGQDQQHFEQMGQVTGWLCIGDEETAFTGPASRDRSWGVRDWLRPEWYNWFHLNFDEDLFTGAVISQAEGQEASSGFVYQKGLFQPIVQVVMEADRDPNDLHLLAGQAHIVTEQGQTFDLDFDPLSFFHIILAREGAWQGHDCVTAVTCRCGGQIGRGVLEYEQREAALPYAPGEAGLW